MNQPSCKRLIPQILAGCLFCGGSWFALIALPFVIWTPFVGAWNGFVYFICGYFVYFGWFWRAWHTPSIFFVTLLWLLSFIQNSWMWFFILREEHWHLPTLHSFQTNGAFGFSFIMFGWWLIASVLSVVALVSEFLPKRLTPK
ncbi:MAG TPA: hypothetical protein VHG71_07355 [Verrucomicrobiae bacterium]|nr:hypothetical protein [Verrucomicrobiae bacterium]